MICGFILHLLIKLNIVQVTEKEAWDPITQDFEPVKLYEPRFNPKSQRDWDLVVKKEFPEDAR